MTADDEKLRIRLAEIMSSAGLGYNQISLEILYLLPAEFVQRYIALWEKAMGPAGSGDGAGQRLARDSNVGVSRTETRKKGTMPIGASSTGKRWRRMGLGVRNERALDLKGKIDKRLRAMGREIRAELEGLATDELEEKAGGGRVGVGITQCGSCGRIVDISWQFCPHDGKRIGLRKSEG